MCCCNDKKQGCEKPANLKDQPAACTPEQIRKCHGNVRSHPCTHKEEAR
jgi:hypothetical protein